NLEREGGEECETKAFMQICREVIVQSRFDIAAAGLIVDRNDSEQREDRAEQRIKEELEGGIDPPRAAPHPDDHEHRDKHAFEEHIEQEEIESAKDADHHCLEDEEGDHVLLHLKSDDSPTRYDAEHGQERRQQNEK